LNFEFDNGPFHPICINPLIMPNDYFKFKQFTIEQDKCAMKVCTDACLFGAFIANCQLPTEHCLDVGTGTGLLSLMLAQKNDAVLIDAFEIDSDAAEQAKENFAASPWADRLEIFNKDILTLAPDPLIAAEKQKAVSKKYDLIICNPPFFEDDLRSPYEAKNKAKHDTALTLVELLHIADIHVTAGGIFAVLLPYLRVDYFIEESAKVDLHLAKQVLIKQTPKHPFFRGILFFSRTKQEPKRSEIIIKDESDHYTAAFAEALKDYYLYL
jgi:tRNA1Val (adenine37-N6)-methyltransferase